MACASLEEINDQPGQLKQAAQAAGGGAAEGELARLVQDEPGFVAHRALGEADAVEIENERTLHAHEGRSRQYILPFPHAPQHDDGRLAADAHAGVGSLGLDGGDVPHRTMRSRRPSRSGVMSSRPSRSGGSADTAGAD